MNIEFRPIDKSNYDACVQLEVAKEHEDFVAPNMYSLVQVLYEPELYPLGIYKDDVMVGFLLYDFYYERNCWSMCRFMIDPKHQGQGIGTRALELFIELMENKYGTKRLHTTASVHNHRAIALYEKFGFAKGEAFQYQKAGTVYHEVHLTLG